MTRGQRIVLEILAPPFLGWAIWLLVVVTQTLWIVVSTGSSFENSGFGNLAGYSMVVFVAAYFFAGLPSLVCTVFMEYSFARGVRPGSWSAVGLAALCGLVSGLSIAAYFGGFADAPALTIFGGMGLAVGMSLGLLVRRFSSRGR